MNKIAAILLSGFLLLSCAGIASGQDASKREVFAPGAKCLIAEHDASAKPDAITKEQADAIVAELKLIRQLLEKQQVQLARAMAPQPSLAQAPPEKVQMNIGNGWYSIGQPDAPVTLV